MCVQPEPCGSVWWRSTAGVVLNYAHEVKEGCEREETTCDDKSGKARGIIEGANYDLATFGQEQNSQNLEYGGGQIEGKEIPTDTGQRRTGLEACRLAGWQVGSQGEERSRL